MSADNGIYILETVNPKYDPNSTWDDIEARQEKNEYRVAHLQAVENVYWDDERSISEDIWIKNAREMWNGCKVFTDKASALAYAAELLEKCYICEYGISFIKIERVF